MKAVKNNHKKYQINTKNNEIYTTSSPSHCAPYWRKIKINWSLNQHGEFQILGSALLWSLQRKLSKPNEKTPKTKWFGSDDPPDMTDILQLKSQLIEQRGVTNFRSCKRIWKPGSGLSEIFNEKSQRQINSKNSENWTTWSLCHCASIQQKPWLIEQGGATNFRSCGRTQEIRESWTKSTN